MEDLKEHIATHLGELVNSLNIVNEELVIVARRAEIHNIILFLQFIEYCK